MNYAWKSLTCMSMYSLVGSSMRWIAKLFGDKGCERKQVLKIIGQPFSEFINWTDELLPVKKYSNNENRFGSDPFSEFIRRCVETIFPISSGQKLQFGKKRYFSRRFGQNFKRLWIQWHKYFKKNIPKNLAKKWIYFRK